MKHLEFTVCRPRRFQTPYFTASAWLKIGAWLFIFGMVSGLLLGSWWNNLINALAR